MKNYKIYQLVLLLTPFVFTFAFGLDIYIPIIPQMADIFETSPALVHLTLSLFLLTTGLGQLFMGPLSDRWGRKRVIVLSSLCYLFGSLGCAISPHIACLIVTRVICALGACGMLTASFALVRDLYSGEENARIYSFLHGAVGVSPTFAPIIGGYLVVYFGWQSLFIFLAGIGGLATFLSWRCIEETHPPQKEPSNSNLLLLYKDIFSHRQFLTYTLISGLAESIFFCFFSISPFIIIDLLNVPTEHFGYYFFVFGAVIAIGGLMGGKLIGKLGIDRTIRFSIGLMLLGGITMVTWYSFFGLSLAGFLFPMALACTGAIFTAGATVSAALEPFGEMAGTAAAAFGAAQFGIAALIGALLMLLPVHSTVPYGIVILLAGTLSSFIFKQRPSVIPVVS